MPVDSSDVNEPARSHRPPLLQPARRNPAQPKHRASKDNSLLSSETLLLDGHDPEKGQRAGRLGRLGSAKLGSSTSLVDRHPEHAPKEQQTDERRDVVPVPVPVPVPIAIGGHHQVLRRDIEDAITFTLHWLLSVAKVVLKILKLPISLALAGYLLVKVTEHTSSFVVSSVTDALSPLCSMPLLSSVPICSQFSQSRPEMQELPFTKLMEVQKGLLPVMEAAGSSTNLALDFKRVEMKISDLNTLVQLSDLENKVKISSALRDFEDSAAIASRHLSRMESNIEGVVTAVLVTDDYVIQTLEHIEHGKQQNPVISAIISSFGAYPSSRTKLIQTFNHMADLMESELLELIESTMAATLTLDQLQVNMKGIYFLVSEAQGQTKNELERTLADLWTIVGGNRAKLARFAGHHSLLSQIGNYHSTATSKVSQALVELQRLEHDLKRLRARVATPMLPNEPTIPLELHIENLRKGVEVLTEGKFQAKRKENQVIEQMGNRRRYPSLGSRK